MNEAQITTWRHKAEQYDDVVAALKAADGGRYRNDTIATLLRQLQDRAAALVAAEQRGMLRAAAMLEDRYRVLLKAADRRPTPDRIEIHAAAEELRHAAAIIRAAAQEAAQ